MNTYLETVLLEARIIAQEMVQKKFNLRPPLTRIHEAFLAGRDYVTGENGESLDELRQAPTQATKVKYLTKMNFTTTNEKTCNPDGDVGGSDSLNVTWVELVKTIKIREKQFAGNEITLIRALANYMYQLEVDMFMGSNSLNSAMLAYLEANRTQVNALSAGGAKNVWEGTPDFHVAVANGDLNRFYNYLLSDMAMNNYNAPFFDIHNTGWLSEVAHYAEQGTANSVNTAYQFDGVTRLPSNLIVPGGYDFSTHYIVPEGGVAVLFDNERLNREGRVSNNSGIWTTQQSMLVPDVTFDVFIKEACADTTTYGGGKQDLVRDIEFTTNYALLKQPVATNETPIFKYVVKKS